MSGIDSKELKQEFVKSKTGIIGIAILSGLLIVSLIAVITIPIDTFKQWNNPNNWISYPKASTPVWVNYFLDDKIPEHIIIKTPLTITKNDTISITSHQFSIEYTYILVCSHRHLFRVKITSSL